MRTTPMPIPKRQHRSDPKTPFLSPDVQEEVRLLIRRMRAESGGAWKPVCKALSMGESHLSLIASDNEVVQAKHKVSAEVMIRVCFAMHISIDALLGRQFDPEGDCIACSAPSDWRKRLAAGKR